MNSSNNKDYCFFKLDENISCIRFLDRNTDKFELEFNLEKGTSYSSFIVIDENQLIVIHPPEKANAEIFLHYISKVLEEAKLNKINFITGHINPKIIECLKIILKRFKNVSITCSNPGFKLIKELWNQKNPRDNNDVFFRPIDISDNTIPNGNAIMLINFIRLGMMEEAKKLSISLNGYLNIYKNHMMTSLRAIDFFNNIQDGKNCNEQGCKLDV